MKLYQTYQHHVYKLRDLPSMQYAFSCAIWPEQMLLIRNKDTCRTVHEYQATHKPTIFML
jgi:hypothetical protein